MSSKIRVLSDHTINKIAAGEVIENPASVVKELVENSIDAGATEVCVEIQGGGRQLIRISDNGCGMNNDDALLCLERHATSKIKEADELHTLSTMGFRGEAIPSIASISKFNLLTCPYNEKEASLGTMVIVDGGKIISCSPAARSPGTTIEVKSLFFNVPVRKKFLKSPSVDANDIFKMISIIALGNPTIKFQLLNDGKSQLVTHAVQDIHDVNVQKQLEERVETVLGNDFKQNTSYISAEDDEINLHGFVGLPSYTRHNRTGQYLFINRRAVVSPFIAFAIKDAFGTSLAGGRYPVFVLHLHLPGDLVDVNVHPQKKEVRLRQESKIRTLIIKAIAKSLHHESSFVYHDKGIQNEMSPVFSKMFHPTFSAPLNLNLNAPNEPEWVFSPKNRTDSEPLEDKRAEVVVEPTTFTPSIKQPSRSLFDVAPSVAIPKKMPKVLTTISRYVVLDGTNAFEFIQGESISSAKGGLVLVDQRAAHSRIIFERLLSEKKYQESIVEPLLLPLSVELTPHESLILRKAFDILQQIGIQIREFGVNTFLIDAIPRIFGNCQVEIFIRDIIHLLEDNPCFSSQDFLEQEIRKNIAHAASKAAMTSERQLSFEEAQTLIKQLIECEYPFSCPFGKPIFVQIGSEELQNFFKR